MTTADTHDTGRRPRRPLVAPIFFATAPSIGAMPLPRIHALLPELRAREA